ncbi:MAG TPA: RNA methyltransferase [Syntrophobacteraceae bacterium]|jgi:tRNA (guanosine-2'-O-)-methyltransferase|nr:RNA methyltransferase [Syntrophobacteraceae bacterium]
MISDRRRARIELVARHRQPDLTVVVENVHDPHNVSAMLRSCDAAGVVQIQLVYTTEAFPKIGSKSSASAGKWVEARRFRSIDQCYEQLKSEGFTILATRIGATSKSLYTADFTARTAIVFGNEHRGVSDEAANGADSLVQIPMVGMIQSLNVSVACAVTLFEALRQRMQAPGWGNPKLPPQELAALVERWSQKPRLRVGKKKGSPQ